MIILTAIIASILISGCAQNVMPENNLKIETIQEKLLYIHNQERCNRGYKKLKLDDNLCSYAQTHSDKMASRNSLYHSNMGDLMDVNNDAMFVGENIAWGQKSEKEVVKSWMNSRGHRKNILNNQYEKVGFGLQKDSKGRIYWCAVFSN